MCIGFDLTISITQYFNLCSSSLPDFKSIPNCSAAKLGNELERSTSRGTQRFAYRTNHVMRVHPPLVLGPRGGRTRSRGNIFADSAVKFPYIRPLIVFGLSFRNWLRFDSV